MLNCGMLTVGRHFVKAPSGRTLYRHGSNMGTVMVYNDKGVQKAMLILDAQYRAKLKYCSSSDYKCLSSYAIPLGAMCGKSGSLGVGHTDASLNSWFTATDAQTAAYNTNVLTASTPYPAAWHCRNKTVGGRTCALPNIQQVARIFCDGTLLDRMDPTAASSSYRLANWGSMNDVWASTEYNMSQAYYVGQSGSISYYTKGGAVGVVPILEL